MAQLHDEQADILGGPILQRPESSVFATFQQYHLVFKSATLLGLGLLVWIACAHGLEHLKKHRELRYRKAMRRKHGIPDSDCRPFAVAYAAAKRAHLEREAQDRKKAINYMSDHNSPPVDQRANAQSDACLLRKRVPEPTVQLHDYHLPGKHAFVYDNKRPAAHLNFSGRYDSGPHHRPAIPESSPVKILSVEEHAISFDNEESKKRSLQDESDTEHEAIKKSRLDGNEPMDGDERADWYAQYSRSTRHASKESLDQKREANPVHMNGQGRSKRVDDLRNEDHEPDEAMEGIDEDEVTELKTVARGKKRDRAEAGSSFGGDDEEDIRNGRASHHRKRRTISRRRVDTPARGQKRDREVESPESEDEAIGSDASRRSTQHNFKKKRGTKAPADKISMKDPRVSKDSLCGGRRVGDDWEADGVQYKVGDSGERLRLTLVKKARNKYHMPQDSQHPDRTAALEIYVEMWMTEEQYKQAEGRQELAWQEEAPESSGPRTSDDALGSPAKTGKSLLWDSVKCSSTRRPPRQLMLPGASTRINPFEKWQSQPTSGRRVASSSTIVSPILLGVADSSTRPGFRGFSKWEKQDREAEALARIRAKAEERRKAQALPEKSGKPPTTVSAPEPGAKSLSVPTITLTPAPPVSADGKSDGNISQNKSNLPTFSFAIPPSTSDSVKGGTATVSAITPGVALPSTTSIAIPPTLLSSGSTIPASSSTRSLSPFSFVKQPLQVPSSATATPSSTMSYMFGKETSAETSSMPTPSPSTMGLTTQSQPLSTQSPKPGPFSFMKPDISTSASSPPATAALATKLRAPNFNAVPGSSPFPGTFGFTPTVPKTLIPTPPVTTAPTTTSENLKPTPPLFSFSGGSSPPSGASPSASTIPSLPKFAFASTTSPSAQGTTSQPKPTFKFGQTAPAATDGSILAADGSKSSGMPALSFGTVARPNEPTKPSLLEGAPMFEGSTFSVPSTSAADCYGKPVAMDSDSSMSTLPRPTLVSGSAATPDSTISSTPRAGNPISGNTPFFSFGGNNSGSKTAEGSRSTSLFRDTAGTSNPPSMFGGNSTAGKPMFTFGAVADGTKAAPAFGGNIEDPRLPSSSVEGPKPRLDDSGEVPKPALVFDIAEGSRSTFTFGGPTENKTTSAYATESSKPSNMDPSKPTPIGFGPFSSASPFTFGKDNAVTSAPDPVGTKPTPSFTSGASPGATGSMLGQSSSFATSGEPSQGLFGRPTNVAFNSSGFPGTGSPSSTSTFAFGKSAAQSQKQEQ